MLRDCNIFYMWMLAIRSRLLSRLRLFPSLSIAISCSGRLVYFFPAEAVPLSLDWGH